MLVLVILLNPFLWQHLELSIGSKNASPHTPLYFYTGPDGPAIPHGSRVKIRLQSFEGWWVDRVPAWITYATIPQGELR